MKKVYFKIGYFHPEDFAISAITFCTRSPRRRYKLYCAWTFKNSWKEIVSTGSLTSLGEAGSSEHRRGILNSPDKGNAVFPLGSCLFFFFLIYFEQKGKEEFVFVPSS